MKQQTKPQPYSPQNPPMYKKNDEIELRELFNALWDGKLIIIIVTALFTVTSIGFVLLTQEWWSSSAKITEVQPQDLAAYQQQVKQYQPIFNIYQDDGTVLVSQELNALLDPALLFRHFVDTFNSSDNKLAFLKKSHDFKQFIAPLTIGSFAATDDVMTKYYHEWYNKITATSENARDNKSPYFITFQVMTKDGSVLALRSYIEATEEKVRLGMLKNLQAIVFGKQNELFQQKLILEHQARNRLAAEIERTKHAMAIAEAAASDKPMQIGNDKEVFSIGLGSNGLKAKVEALESVDNLSVIEPRLQQVNAKLEMLSSLKIDKNIDFRTFRFLGGIERPVTRDGPKRAFIIVLGSSLGGMLSILFVLIRFTLKNKD